MSRQDRIEQWLRPPVKDLKPYYKAPLEGNPLRLDQNTNLYAPNPVAATVTPPPADMYPTRDSDALLHALADLHGLTPENFVIGNGSDEILDILTKTFTRPGQTMACPAPSYSLYPFYAKLQDLQFAHINLTPNFELDVDGLLGTGAALYVVPNPNNPTGNCFSNADLEELIAGSNAPVVIDEAYIEYAGLASSFIGRIDEFDNLLVMRTLSKAHGLAGLRIGYLAGNRDLIAKLLLVKPPFNLNVYSEAVAVAAVSNLDWVNQVVAQTQVERERLGVKLSGLGFKVHHSDANFILCEHEIDPAVMHQELLRRGILVRTFAGKPGLERKIRFGVGKPEHTDALVAALQEIVA